MLVITGALINRKSAEVIAVGEWEALEVFLRQMSELNKTMFNKRDYDVVLTPSQDTINKSDVCMFMSYGNVLNIRKIPRAGNGVITNDQL